MLSGWWWEMLESSPDSWLSSLEHCQWAASSPFNEPPHLPWAITCSMSYLIFFQWATYLQWDTTSSMSHIISNEPHIFNEPPHLKWATHLQWATHLHEPHYLQWATHLKWATLSPMSHNIPTEPPRSPMTPLHLQCVPRSPKSLHFSTSMNPNRLDYCSF